MGASYEAVTVSAKTAAAAYRLACDLAAMDQEEDCEGYAGDITTTTGYVLFAVPDGSYQDFMGIVAATSRGQLTSAHKASRLYHTAQRYYAQAQTKWGKAACVQVSPGTFRFDFTAAC